MKSPVYRNLDKSFQLFGLKITELFILIVILIFGGEVSQIFSINRLWIFILTILTALSFFWIRKSLGDFFAGRILRFLMLPRELKPKLILIERVRYDKTK